MPISFITQKFIFFLTPFFLLLILKSKGNCQFDVEQVPLNFIRNKKKTSNFEKGLLSTSKQDKRMWLRKENI